MFADHALRNYLYPTRNYTLRVAITNWMMSRNELTVELHFGGVGHSEVKNKNVVPL